MAAIRQPKSILLRLDIQLMEELCRSTYCEYYPETWSKDAPIYNVEGARIRLAIITIIVVVVVSIPITILSCPQLMVLPIVPKHLACSPSP